MTPAEIKRWLDTLEPESDVCIDEGGLCLIELDDEGEETGSYLEIGGHPCDND
jgi:hypothetical protein